MNPLTLLETFRQLAIVRGVASSIQGPHRASWFSRPTLVPPPHGFTEAKPRQQIRSPGAAAAMSAAACTISSCQCRGNLHPVSLSPGLARIKDGGGRGEGGNQLFRPRSQRGGEKGKAFEESSEQSGRVLEESQVRSPEV